MPKYRVELCSIDFYSYIVEADDKCAAEEMAKEEWTNSNDDQRAAHLADGEWGDSNIIEINNPQE